MKQGDKVTYIPNNEKGVVSFMSKIEGCIFVVYNCDENWRNYYNYTGALTRIKDLKLGWPKEEQSSEM